MGADTHGRTDCNKPKRTEEPGRTKSAGPANQRKQDPYAEHPSVPEGEVPMTGHFVQGAWVEDPEVRIVSFMKIYLCASMDPDHPNDPQVLIQPVLRGDLGKPGTALNSMANDCVRSMAMSLNDRTEAQKVAERAELMRFTKRL